MASGNDDLQFEIRCGTNPEVNAWLEIIGAMLDGEKRNVVIAVTLTLAFDAMKDSLRRGADLDDVIRRLGQSFRVMWELEQAEGATKQ